MDQTVSVDGLVLHPSLTAYFNKWIRNLALPLVAIALMVLVYRWATIPGARSAFLLTGVAIALFAIAFFSRAEIAVRQGTLTYRRFLRRRRFPLESVGGLALRRLSLRGNYYARRPAPYAVVYGRDRRALFSFSAALWPDRDLDRLQRAIGGDASDVPLSASELHSEFPGALPGWLMFYEAHPFWTLAIGTPLMLVAVTIAVVLWDSVK